MNQKELDNLKKKILSIENELESIKKAVYSNESEKPSIAKKPIITNINEEIRNIPDKITQKTRSWLDWEVILAGNWMAKVGIFTVLLATLWFLEKAFSNDWITDSAKIWLGLIFGWGMSIAGNYYASKGYKILTPALLGGGFSIIYLSIFSAYRFYNFMGIEESFAYLLLLSIVMVVMSKLSKSEAIYCFGLMGLILLPILLSTGENSYKILFSYLALNLVLFGWASHGLSWKWGSILLLVANWILFDIWLYSELSLKAFWVPLVFLVFLVGFYLYREHFLERESNKTIHPFVPGFIVTGSLLVGGMSLSYLLDGHYPDLEGYGLLSMAFMAAITGFKIPASEYSFQRIPLLLYSILTLVFLSIIFQVSDDWIGFSFVGFAFVFSYSLGNLFKDPSYGNLNKFTEYFLWGLVIFRIVLFDGRNNLGYQYSSIVNIRFLLYVITVLGMGYIYYRDRIHSILDGRTKFFGTSAVVLLIWAFLLEVHYGIRDESLRNQGYSLVLGSFAGIFLSYGIRRVNPFYRKIGLFLVGMVIIKFALYDIWLLSLTAKIISGFVMGIILIVLGLYYEKIKNKLLGEQNEK